MEAYAQALTYAIPFFLVLILIEAIAGHRMGVRVLRSADTISSLSSGMTNTLKDVLGLGIALVSYEWLHRHLAFFSIRNSVTVYITAFLVLDFAGYWMHRLSHEVNILWNRHIIHHSSEEFNLPCALRQSISEVFSFIAIFMIPAAVVGVPPKVMAIIAPFHLFAQFWYHTTLIGKMGFLEHFLVTPSHHRVHHAMNAQYLDKNYGQIFIFWDKWFGTFQEELPDVPPVYGVKRPVRTWNPIKINFQHLWLLLRDAWNTRDWGAKMTLWFRPTGWRPMDAARILPVEIVEDVRDFEKYDANPGLWPVRWAWVQLVLGLLLLMYLFNQFAAIGFPGVLWYALYMTVSVYAYTTLLDADREVVAAETLRLLLGLGLMAYQGWDWFGMARMHPMLPVALSITMLLSWGLTMFWAKGFGKMEALRG